MTMKWLVSFAFQNNPVLSFDEDVLLEDEDPVAMTTGEDEEGAINDSSTDILKETDNKMKVCCPIVVSQKMQNKEKGHILYI